MTIGSVERIEPALIEDLPEQLSDRVAELAADTATLGRVLHPQTAAGLAGVLRLMNTYYSNLIEGHHTKPRDIERPVAPSTSGSRPRRLISCSLACSR